MSIRTTQINGDVSVGKDVSAGGNLLSQGSAHIKGRLRVDGWLEAPNIKGAFKGLFVSLDALKKAYPKPQEGWFAIVGDTIPGVVYRAESGSWTETGETGGELNVDLTKIESDIEKLQSDVIANADGISVLGEHVWPLEIDVKVNGEEPGTSVFEWKPDNTTTAEITVNVKRNGSPAYGSIALTHNGSQIEAGSDIYSIAQDAYLKNYGHNDFNVEVSAEGLIQAVDFSLDARRPMYLGFCDTEEITYNTPNFDDIEHGDFGKFVRKSLGGRYIINNPKDGYYLWFCFPDDSEELYSGINDIVITLDGIRIPIGLGMLANHYIQTYGGYECRRSQHPLKAGKYILTIEFK